MKINVEIDCTPQEARAFMGLPNLTPIHDKYLSMMTDSMDGVVSPDLIENMMRSWAPVSDASMGLWRTMFERAAK